MSEKLHSGKNCVKIENDVQVAKAVGERVTRLAMANALLASIAVAVVYFAGTGQARK